MKFCECGRQVAEIRTPNGKKVPVDLWPIPYTENDKGRMELLTKDGRTIRTNGSPPKYSKGIAYHPHRCPSLGNL
mgnify:CR=1 FL=1